MRNVYLLLLILLTTALPSKAQQVRFFDSQYRLPGSLIDRIFQDPHGNVWFTGKSGAIKYGGMTFSREPLRYTNAPTLPWVKCMEFLDGERILFGTSRGLVLNECMTDTFKMLPIYINNTVFDNYFVSSVVKSQKLGAILVTCSGNGIAALDPNTLEPLKPLTDTINQLIDTKFPGAMYIDSRNNLWTFSSEGNFINIDLNTLTRSTLRFQDGILPSAVTSVTEVPTTGDILIGTSHSGILRYNQKDNIVTPTKATADITGGINVIMHPRAQGTDHLFWIGSEEYGLMLYDNNTQKMITPSLRNDNIDLHNCKIHDIFEDRQGNIWAAVYQKGGVFVPKSAADYIINNQQNTSEKNNAYFTFLSVAMNEGSGPNLAPVTAIVGTRNGTIYAGTDGGGVIKLEQGGKKTRICTTENGLPNNSINAMTADNDGNLWIATYNGGLSVRKPDGKIENLFTNPEFQKISHLTFDTASNTLYAGTLGNGTHVLTLKNGKITSQHNISQPQWVHHVYVSKRGYVMINSTIIYTVTNDTVTITDQVCACATDDNEGNLYLGGEDWLCRYNPDTKTLTSIIEKAHKGTILSMATDHFGNLWYSTDDRLVHYSIKEGGYETFTTMDGLPSNEFCSNAIYKGNDGALFLGTNNGMIIFHPAEGLQKIAFNAEIYFNSLSVAGENITFGNSQGIIDAPINLASRITMKHSQNKFTLQFGINEYANQHRIKFRYRLKGFDDTWYRVRQMARILSFTNIPEGDYTLEIKAFIENNETQSVSKSIAVTVLPPWYNTWWAYLAYAVVGIIILLIIKALAQNKHTLKIQREENQKKEMRLQMFTNLSHEIRTPLSLVETPLNSLIETENDKKKSAILQLMRRNVQRVTSQLNRIMDIRKIDNNKFVLKLQNADIVDFISDIVKSFDQLSLMRNININLNTNNFDIKFAFDPYNLDKAVFNILSNAFKFTPDGGFINIHIEKTEEPFVSIKIENSGSHIPPEECEKIFERFYQTSDNSSHEGSGIGLHLAKMIIDAHKGFIKAYNTEQGVEFAITLPCYNINEQTENEEVKTPKHDLFVDIAQDTPADSTTNKKLKKILFIDDDSEWTGYISMALSDKFNPVVCNHPEQAINQIIAEKPDAIITDLVMPGLNGYDLCKKIRQNPQTSLLPIIVLTSKADEESRQTCVEIGVDHYLTKPVSINMLKSSITNAITTREKMAARMAADIHSAQTVIEAESPDQILLKKVVDTINKNLENTNFGVNELSAKVGISRVHLNRKLKELLDITPVNLIKSIKMRQAAILLVRNKLNVADVAFKLGFSSHSYFSSHFKEYYGISPTEFVTKYSANENQEEFEKMVKM